VVRENTSTSGSGNTGGIGAGQPLEPATRDRFETQLGADLSDVRVHTDSASADAARDLGASAYTVGSHIVFGRDTYNTLTPTGSWLLAHELAHVVQHARHGAAVVHRAAEDIPRLDSELYGGVRSGGDAGYAQAANALNFMADFDILKRLSDNPGEGRPVLTRDQVMQIHLAAVKKGDLGPESAAARFTRYAYLDINYEKERDLGNWEMAAEYLNGFNETDINIRLHRGLSTSQLQSLQLGAIRRFGPKSPIAISVEKALHDATQALIKGATPVITVGGVSVDPGVPAAQREPLDPNVEWENDPKYIDNGVAKTWYNILTNYFEIEYADGSFIGDLDYDRLLAAAGTAGPALKQNFFRNKANGRIYPSSLAKSTVPVLARSAVETHKKEPEAREHLKQALIEVAFAAHGAASAIVHVGATMSGSLGQRGRPAQKRSTQEPSEGAASKASGQAPSRGAGAQPKGADGGGAAPKVGDRGAMQPKSGAGQAGAAGGAAEEGGRISAAPQGKAGAQAGESTGGLQRVGPTTKPSFIPTEGMPSGELMRDLPPGARFGGGFAAQKAAGEILMEAEKLGSGRLVAAEAGAIVEGATTVAQGTLKVGLFQVANAALVTGGKFLIQHGPTTGRQVLYALILRDSVRLIVSSAPGTEIPAKAPGAESTPAQAPGAATDIAKAPGKDIRPVQAPGAGPAGPVSAPGAADRPKETLLAAANDRQRAARILKNNNVPDTKKNIDAYLDLLKRYNEALSGIDESLFQRFEDYAIIDINIGALRGSRSADFDASDELADRTYGKAAGYTTKLRDRLKLTWHHHPEMGRMILMRTSVHSSLSHWGGVSVWTVLTGKDYP
ncbi:MAG TPA: DUF4157 domain-containing protein, partial [Mycobacterium sp.]|nr:DUF4157 domain-containing protein [Mycobacterium sp.]